MEITGSFYPPALYPSVSYPGTNQTAGDPQTSSPPDKENRQAPTTIQPTIKAPQNEYEPNRRRFYNQEKDLPHPARQAINSYIDSDFAGGPELVNRVDVYA